MRIWIHMILACLAGACCSLFLWTDVSAQVVGEYGERGDYTIEDDGGNSKYSEDLLDRIVGNENADTGIIDTDLDNVDQQLGGFENDLKISNTLDSTRMQLADYIQWIAFLGLSLAVAMIVYNGFLLVFSPLAEDQIAQVKKRLIYIITGTLTMTGFYLVMRLLLSFLVEILSKS